MMLKDDVTNLILDLMFPFDPFSFAGEGSKYQKEVQKLGMDRYLEFEDNYIDDFARSYEPHELIDTLLELLELGPDNNININKREEWDYYIQVVLVKLGHITSGTLINKLEKHLCRFNDKRTFVIEVLTSVFNKSSHDAVLRVMKNNVNLSHYEVELIKEFEESIKGLSVD